MASLRDWASSLTTPSPLDRKLRDPSQVRAVKSARAAEAKHGEALDEVLGKAPDAKIAAFLKRKYGATMRGSATRLPGGKWEAMMVVGESKPTKVSGSNAEL